MYIVCTIIVKYLKPNISTQQLRELYLGGEEGKSFDEGLFFIFQAELNLNITKVLRL